MSASKGDKGIGGFGDQSIWINYSSFLITAWDVWSYHCWVRADAAEVGEVGREVDQEAELQFDGY
jgi:hypothetical protein